MENRLPARYLTPYLRAAERFGAGFESLLWADPSTQSARFAAIEKLGKLHGKSVLDVGCGRADLIDFLHMRGVMPADYIGIEAVPVLAQAAEQKSAIRNGMTILQHDFVKEPQRMFVGADVIVFSGSLNTIEEDDFLPILRRAFEAAGNGVVFNFLASPTLASASFLRWRKPDEVLKFATGLSPHVQSLDDYLAGDCTVGIFHEKVPALQ